METTYPTQRSRRNSLTPPPVNASAGARPQPEPARDRECWRAEAILSRTDWSSILRQRIRVLAWVRAGRPPLSKWHAGNASEDGS
jgi:hypothetical protein